MNFYNAKTEMRYCPPAVPVKVLGIQAIVMVFTAGLIAYLTI